MAVSQAPRPCRIGAWSLMWHDSCLGWARVSHINSDKTVRIGTSPNRIQMTYIEKSIQVGVPIRTAHKQWVEFGDFLLFYMDGVKEVNKVDDYTIVWRAELAGAEVKWTSTIAVDELDPRASSQGTASGSNNGSVTFQALDSKHCRITSRLEFDPEDFTENVDASPGHVITKVWDDLRRFKKFFERSVREPQPWHRALQHRAAI